MSDGNAAYWDAVLFDRIAPKPKPAGPDKLARACRKSTKQRFKQLREPEIPAEKVALDLLKGRCKRCPSNDACWGPGR